MMDGMDSGGMQCNNAGSQKLGRIPHRRGAVAGRRPLLRAAGGSCYSTRLRQAHLWQEIPNRHQCEHKKPKERESERESKIAHIQFMRAARPHVARSQKPLNIFSSSQRRDPMYHHDSDPIAVFFFCSRLPASRFLPCLFASGGTLTSASALLLSRTQRMNRRDRCKRPCGCC
jgi:hypothetical protein